ncbi:MAG: WD40 repeat domain-containing protein [Pirellulaceae bacterium]
MSIKVVCGCGFFTLLPSDWEGKRVKCKCGRTFIVGETGALVEPPAVVEPHPPVAPPAAIHAMPPAEIPQPPASAAPPTLSPAASGSVDLPAQRANIRPRVRHASRSRKKIVLAVIMLLLAVASTSAFILVVRDHGWSVAAILGSPPRQGLTPPPASDSTAQTSSPPSVPPSADKDDAAASGPEVGTAAGSGTATALANLTELVAEDGLLLTGMFGDGAQRLQLSESQQETVNGLVSHLKQNEQGLKDKSLTLEQWYADSRKAGEELLTVLTDAQRQQLQVMLERNEIPRLHLVEYSARIRPELAVAQMPWAAPSEGRSFRAIAKSSFIATGQERASRASEPTGWFATISAVAATDAPRHVSVWDLAKDEQVGGFDITSPLAESVTFLSRDGLYWVLARKSDTGAEMVEVWSTQAGKLIGSKELPSIGGAACVPRDCVVHQVVGLAGPGYWTWDFETGDARTIEFPDSAPDAAPGFALSAEGKYLVVAHVHGTASPPDESSFVEICLYRLESGELLGNQVFHKDYRGSTINAMAFSNDGRELAMLWDFGPSNPERRLVHMSSANGKVIKMVEGLPPAEQGYAHQHHLTDRDLFWLSENSGWVVNLQNVVDAETGAVLDLNLPLPSSEGFGTGTGNSNGSATAEVVEAAPTGDGRLLLIVAEPMASPDQAASMRTQFLDLPKLGPFQ